MEQGRLWIDLPAAEPRQRAGRPPRGASTPAEATKPARQAEATTPARPATLPLWAPEPEPARPDDSPAAPPRAALTLALSQRERGRVRRPLGRRIPSWTRRRWRRSSSGW